jgi:hypothetical protein
MEETMRATSRRATRTLATAATVLVAVPLESALAGQARGSLQVTVQVVAACGGTVAADSVAVTDGCAPGSAPMAILSESATATTGDQSAPATATVEGTGELRYVTLIY